METAFELNTGGARTLDRSRPPRCGRPPVVRPPEVRSVTLPNGLTAHATERRGAREVVLCLALPAGVSAEPAGCSGLAQLTAGSLTRGAAGRTAMEFARWSERLGIVMPIYVDHDAMRIAVHCLGSVFDEAVEILAAVVLSPNLDSAEIGRVRTEQLAAAQGRRGRPEWLADEVCAAEVFGDHEYGRPTAGTPEQLAGLECEAVRRFHDAHMGARGAVLAVCGGVAPERAIAVIEREFGTWARGGGCRPVGAPRRLTPKQPVVVECPHARLAEIRVGAVVPAFASPDAFPIHIADAILGGIFSSRLNMKLREEKGWCYAARTRLQLHRAAGSLVACAAVEPALAGTATLEVIEELSGLSARPPTRSELRHAKRALALSVPRQFETCGRVSRCIVDAATLGVSLGYWADFARRIEAVTLDDVVAAAARYLARERLTAIVVGNDDAARSMASIGPVVVRSDPRTRGHSA